MKQCTQVSKDILYIVKITDREISKLFSGCQYIALHCSVFNETLNDPDDIPLQLIIALIIFIFFADIIVIFSSAENISVSLCDIHLCFF